jgi:cellulose synthase/poly-beta-1,6-N-acetylglucosamine synthase-like glycosyltransferase
MFDRGRLRMRVAVLVPTFRRPAYLQRCLDGLARQVRRPDEVVVVWRKGQDPETEEILQRGVPELRDVLRPIAVNVPGLVPALAAGVSATTADVLAVTDDDAVARPEWLASLLRHYSAGVGGVGGRDVIHTSQGIVAGRTAVVGRVTWFGRVIGNHHTGFGAPRPVDVLKGVNMSLRRELWRFDFDLVGRGAQVHSELHLCLRARQRGWKLVYDPQAIVDHYPASRPEGDERHVRAPEDVEAAAYNQTLALLAYCSTPQVIARALYRLLVGDRGAPGLARAVLGCIRSEGLLKDMPPALRGVCRAIRKRFQT